LGAGSIAGGCRLIDGDVDAHIRGRDRDRAIERSPVAERVDQGFRLVLGHAAEVELEVDGVEEVNIRPDWVGGVHRAADGDGDGGKGYGLGASDGLKQLDAARGDGGEEELGGCDFLTGAAVVDGAIHDVVMVADTGEDPAKDVG
jgi:hypothetical protein